MSNLALVYATFPDMETAQRIGRTTVSERAAACANILSPMTSIYEWQGRLEENGEVPALFKTTPENVEALIARIVELHPYEVPAVLKWPVDQAHAPFVEWVYQQTI